MSTGLRFDRVAPSAAWRSPGFESELAPDVLVPAQFAAPAPTERLDRPEVRLMIAVLEEALATYQRCAAGGHERARAMRDVERWLSSDDPSWLFSFVGICEVLGFQPSQVRDDVERWRTAQDDSALLQHRYPYRRVAQGRGAATQRACPSDPEAEAAASGQSCAHSPRGGGRT